MKLLYCQECNDIFKLNYELKTCECGKVKGRYLDSLKAEVNGKGISLAIDNNSMIDVIYQKEIKKKINITCWVRPHEGFLNPNTKINNNL